MTYTTPDADARRTTIDAVIFDMDGVLLDISGSIRVVNCLSVPFFLRTVLGWPAPDRAYADVATFGASRVVGEALEGWLAGPAEPPSATGH